MKNTPKRHHYLPQFFIRNFAIDEEQKKVMAVQKHGNRAVWAKKSIKSIAYEVDLYVHTENGAPKSVETKINTDIETPISKSETWRKIAENSVADLDNSDRGVLYSLLRNFEARTPHYRQTTAELVKLAGQPHSNMNFSKEEKDMYNALGSDPSLMNEMMSTVASSLEWTAEEFYTCGISILRVNYPVYVCTTPVHVMKSPSHSNLRPTQLGLEPFSYLMPLASNAYMMLSLGDFDGDFKNQSVSLDVEMGLKRQIVSQFAYWPRISHMICDGTSLVDQLKWAEYKCISDTTSKKTFERLRGSNIHQEIN